MIRKFINKLLAPVIREVLKEEKSKEEKASQYLSGVAQEAILKHLHQKHPGI